LGESHGGREEDAKPDVDVKVDVGDEDGDNRYEGGDREGMSTHHGRSTKTAFPQKTGDEKWESALDTKLKPLLETVDVVEYGGRDVQE
jgi:acetoin utilization deacetylase AcuC-like enzyme